MTLNRTRQFATPCIMQRYVCILSTRKELPFMAFTIYISNTSPELDNVRAILLQQITQKGMSANWLTDDERQRPDMLDIVRRKIASADAFISLVTYLHGWTPPNMGSKSLTEIECDLALQ